MLLTIKQPTQPVYKSFYEYTPPTPPSASRFSPALSVKGPTYPPVSRSASQSLPPLSQPSVLQSGMSQPHRGLPPPSAMTLPQPQQPPGPIGQPPLTQTMGQLPAPPQQWQGAEDNMRNWLSAKAEEDKRKQEEERTRQEALRLEQRKIEQDMLRTSLSGGIPPYMIPMVFAGMGGGNLPNASLEWAQHHFAQLQQQQMQSQHQQQLLQSQAHTSPEQLQRRDSRGYVTTNPSAMTLPSTPIGQPISQSGAAYVPSHPMSPGSRSRQVPPPQGSGIMRSAPNSQLPRLNTSEMQIQHPPPGPGAHSNAPGHPLQQTQTVQQEASSPSIYFHHWQPPTSQANTSSNNPPSTPSDQTSSPRKRKNTGVQQPPPPPTSQPQYTSPPFSQAGGSVAGTPHGRRRGHSRQRSDVSARGYDYGRSNRHRQNEGGFTSRNLASPILSTEQGHYSQESRPHSRSAHPVSSLLQRDDSGHHAQNHQDYHDSPRYSTGSEMRHRDRHDTPESELARHKSMIKRDGARD